ncbi:MULTISPECIES: FtsW/RodA/SpoVE family cell cycle protein [unclassified Lactobacillus]|uniref:FtsW/RodA/SpoVE family cell cycle protein n=1 Tax=unclassified Lactobacillus TaxID=2620435 RepID=UPI000EFBE458|nr:MULTISPECIES: FtsW/RodA/SpoVE family cell cycle protein [unclassified Lactobacillus]RMC25132.1 FtsW/RodA/SpoVE family cell cycle protein [Lactobacillus sp. ESL0247]RMC29286.1 FtsW/RodA/SpoVE family cell cycle protein [Lactobacillus sp. ESL0246]RMC32307.1 FtsW/RodA/SpoVE family cell cycle protein [Lactobacillus sp. ESL0245]RMC48722.1 FtsW/RodA/SpoVE family cell cycle protein [Lactobacillus sp. ESL0228]
MRKKLLHIDYQILLPYLLLVAFGIIMVYSASSDILLVNGFKPSTYGIRQMYYAFFAIFIFANATFALRLDIFKSQKFVIWFVALSIVMLLYLILLKIFKGSAVAVNGAVGWIDLKIIKIQPLEIAKLALVIYLAYFLDRHDGTFNQGNIMNTLSRPAILAAVMMFLVLIEPDLGGTAILAMIVIVMFSLSGISAKKVVFWLIIIGITVFILVYLIITWNPKFLQANYQYQRLMSFLHPFELEQKGGAQLVNSYYAIHNGGLFGVGLGNSMQKRGYLPEPYTDFILSIIAEELGVVGALVVLGLLFYLMWRIMEVGIHSSSQFNSLICFGITTIIFTETLFNVGAVLGLLPITGVTLPFISYGGSSLIVLSIAIGLVLNISANEKIKQEEAIR